VDVSALAASIIAMQQSQLATNLQMAVMKSSIQAEAAVIATLLEAATPANPPHLGNLVDTTA